MGYYAEGYEKEQNIEIGPKEEELVGFQPRRLVFGREGVCEASEEGLWVSGTVAVF